MPHHYPGHMSARWYVREAQAQVAKLKARLRQYDFDLPYDASVDLELIAQAFLDCEIISQSNLTDRRALEFLASERGIGVDFQNAEDRGLAGALYVTVDGFRFIFLEAGDSPQRQRFSLAHEIGHLLLEAESIPHPGEYLFPHNPTNRIHKFGRCPQEYMELTNVRDSSEASNSTLPARVRAYQARKERNKSEWRANFFAAELLMPYEGVRALLQVKTTGIQSREDLEGLAATIARAYNVSQASATLRLTKDFAIIPTRDSSNRDLFS